MRIVLATEEDLGQIAFLESAIEGPDAASLETLKSRLAMFREGFFVAKVDAKVVGYIETCIWTRETPQYQADPDFFTKEHRLDGDILYIIFVGVEDRQRRHGIGSLLVTEAFAKVRKEFSVRRVHAVSRDPIIPFYQNMGFSLVQTLPGFLPDGQNYSLMELRQP